MNSIQLIGVNHRTAPVQVREQLAFSREGVATALMLFRASFPDSEAALISTCNRVEMVVIGKDGHPGLGDVLGFFAQARDLPVSLFRPHIYHLKDQEAVHHLFRVISGLDSMVIGEAQIVNQVKQAYAISHEQGAAGPVLHRLFHHAFGVSKRIRSETDICEGKLSVPSVAVDVLRETVVDFAKQRVLIIGAGEMAQLTCQYMMEQGVRDFTITTRTVANARALAAVCDGRAAPFKELDDELAMTDVVVAATSAPNAFLTKQRMASVQERRGGRGLIVIDLAVPRNVEADVARVPGVSLYDVDTLGRIVTDNEEHRRNQVDLCQGIVRDEVQAFTQWVGESRVKSLIDQMYQDVRAMADHEMRRLVQRNPDLSDPHREAVEQMAERLIAKLMHPCVFAMRQHNQSVPPASLAAAFHTVRMNVKGEPETQDRRGAGRGRTQKAGSNGQP